MYTVYLCEYMSWGGGKSSQEPEEGFGAPGAGVSEIFASCLTWALGTEFWSFGNTMLLLNY